MEQTVRPSEINISNRLVGSRLGKSEYETVACSIVILSRRRDDSWFSFTWEDYRLHCDHKVTNGERAILDAFVEDGLLKCNNGIYSAQDAFICTLRDYISEKGEWQWLNRRNPG